MTKLVLDVLNSGSSLSVINDNFQKIQTEFQGKVLYRDNPVGEPNSLSNDLDMNGKRIYNLPAPIANSEVARLQDVKDAIGNQSTASLTSFTPGGNISAVTVQGAIQELDSEKVSLVSLAASSGASLVNGTWFSGVVATVSELATSTGTSLLGWSRALTGSVSTSLYKFLGWGRPSAFEFMTDAQITDCTSNTAALDCYASLQAAIDATTGSLRLLNGKYRLSAQLIIRNNCTGIVGEGMYSAVLDKRFSGDAVSCLTNGAYLRNFGVEGNGATYAGGGVVPKGYNTKLHNLRINDTADSCIIVNAAIGSSALSATYLNVSSCFLSPTNYLTTHGIRSIGADEAGRPTCRVFHNISGGSSLVDFSGMNYATLTDSLGTSVKFSANSGKVTMRGNRITAQDNIIIYGQDHIIDGNFWGFGVGKALSIDASATNVTFGPNNPISVGSSFSQSIVDGVLVGSANTNNLYTQLKTWAFNWFGTTTNYVPGNGTFVAYYKQDGRLCTASIGLIVGSTTSIASGDWSFQLPFKANVTATGTAKVKSSSGTHYSAIISVQGGSSVAYLWLMNPTATKVMDSTMLAFSANALIEASISYEIATS